MIGWEDGTRDIFCVEGFPYKDQIEELFVGIVLFYVCLTRNVVNYLTNFTILT